MASCTGPTQILAKAPFSACGTPEEEEALVNMSVRTFFKRGSFLIIFAISDPFFLWNPDIRKKLDSAQGY
jgi:hypothetical protein